MRQVIDSHVHFWEPAVLTYPWLAGIKSLNRPFLPDALPAAHDDWRMEHLVFVQADCLPEQGLAEAQWVASLADTRIRGIVAFAPLELGGAVRPQLEQLAAVPQVKGVRRLLQSEPLGFSTEPNFIAGVQALADFGFSFDICVVHTQLADVIELVQQCPNVSFVLDHCGKPDIANGLVEPWREHITQLAQLANVHCKLSGLVTEADHDNWKLADLRPHVEHVFEAFGTARVMYGGDWPVVELAADYGRWLSTAATLLAHLDEAAQRAIFYENAQRFYRLEGL